MDYVLQNTGNTQDDLKTLLKYYKDHLYLAENYYKDEGKAEKARKMTNFAKRPCKIGIRICVLLWPQIPQESKMGPYSTFVD